MNHVSQCSHCHLFAKSLREDILKVVQCNKLEVGLSWQIQEKSIRKTEWNALKKKRGFFPPITPINRDPWNYTLGWKRNKPCLHILAKEINNDSPPLLHVCVFTSLIESECLLTHFNHRNAAEVTLCQFWAESLRRLRSFCFCTYRSLEPPYKWSTYLGEISLERS